MRDLALAAVLEVADAAEQVGPFLSEARTDEVLVVRFSSLHPGYPGWHWSVALVGDDVRATVNEVWMEPGEGALPLPEWKPWSERVRPGDLGAGDVVTTDPQDPRLTAGYTGAGEPGDELHPEQWQPGLGRARVLSVEGIADAVERWRSGEDGPDSQVARLADFPCSTCGWLLPIGGQLGQAFGVCAHDMSPSDGHIVALDHGCGAHSDVKAEPTPIPVTDLLIDETVFIAVDRDALPAVEAAPAAEAESAAAPASDEVSVDDSAEHPLAPANDVTETGEADDDAREGDVTPPEAVVLAQEVVEDEARGGE